jgi:hypothetical protein
MRIHKSLLVTLIPLECLMRKRFDFIFHPRDPRQKEFLIFPPAIKKLFQSRFRFYSSQFFFLQHSYLSFEQYFFVFFFSTEKFGKLSLPKTKMRGKLHDLLTIPNRCLFIKMIFFPDKNLKKPESP